MTFSNRELSLIHLQYSLHFLRAFLVKVIIVTCLKAAGAPVSLGGNVLIRYRCSALAAAVSPLLEVWASFGEAMSSNTLKNPPLPAGELLYSRDGYKNKYLALLTDSLQTTQTADPL